MSATIDHSPASRRRLAVGSRLRRLTAPGRPLTIREAAFAAVALLVMTAVLYGPHAIKGGFLLDDWSNYVAVEFFGATLLDDVSRFVEGQSTRPLTGAYYGFFMHVFGQHMGWWLAWIAGLGMLVSLSLFVLLRLLRFETVDAFAIAALVLVFPGSDTLRLWAVGGGENIPIGATIAGLALALLAFRASGGRAWGLHAVSLLLFVSSLLFVEMTLAVMLLSGLVYLLAAPWRRAVARWVVDVVVLLALVLLVSTGEGSIERQTVDGMWNHAGLIIEQAWTLFTTIVLPFGEEWWMVVLPFLALVAAGAVAAVRLDRGDPRRAVIRRWLAAIGAGLVVVGASYAIYVPAADWYAPMQPGVGNRVNGMAAVGWLLMVYGVFRLLGALVVRQRFVAVAAPALAVLLGAVYIDRTLEDAAKYQQAFQLGREALLTMRTALPDPPDDAMVYAFGQPLETAPGIPVFHASWDLNSAARVLWSDPTVRALPAFPSLQFRCGRTEIEPMWGIPDGGREFRSRYGRTFFIDTTTGRGMAITSRRVCRDAAASWPRSPLYPPPPAA